MKQLRQVILQGILLLAFCNSGLAQYQLKGTITSSQTPLPFATVLLLNTQLSAIAGADGSYEFNNLKEGIYKVRVKCIGYAEKTGEILVSGNQQLDVELEASSAQLDEVVVDATRVDKNTGMAFNNLSEKDIQKQNLGQDAPFVLGQLPSVVVNSDAGNGVGYTGLRIRGSDGTRINITINGVPVNDAESQGTFFVNMPDFLSGVNSIQVQRGVGASSNGAGAFGATINFQTNQVNTQPYAKVISTGGSFNTFRNTLAAGTGLINKRFTLDARASRITSNGYIDRAASNLQSYYLAAGYYGRKSVFKFINFMGQEKTYQAWYYVPQDSLKKGNRTYNPAGEYYDAQGRVNYYPNETDNYKQNNFQLHFIHTFNSRTSLNVTGHYTKGAGYYEQYKQGAALSEYGLPPVITGKNDTIVRSNLVRRLWLDNDFAGGIFNLHHKFSGRLNMVLGGGYNTYFGRHFGRLMWMQYASTADINHRYYFNTANKNDGNVYLKANYRPMAGLHVFADMQVRHVAYRFLGFDAAQQQVPQDVNFVFYNPKLGLSYDVNARLNAYASVAMANKEPNRNDFTESSPGSRPKHEQLTDVEAGLKYTRRSLNMAFNVYNMRYRNQLVLNGQVNDVGAYTRINVPNSYRRGVELELGAEIGKHLALNGNVAFSRSKIKNFTEFVDSSDASGSVYYAQHRNTYKNTDISFSPNVVGAASLIYKPLRGFEITLVHKYVGRQYLDNTGNTQRSIAPYTVFDLRLNYSIKTELVPEVELMLGIYNLTNRRYETNGYTFGYYAGGQLYTYNYLAPAAPINVLGGVALKF